MKGFKKGYCKYCYRHINLILDYDADLIRCPICNYGLAPLGDALKYKSFYKWYESVVFSFYGKFNKLKLKK